MPTGTPRSVVTKAIVWTIPPAVLVAALLVASGITVSNLLWKLALFLVVVAASFAVSYRSLAQRYWAQQFMDKGRRPQDGEHGG